MIEVAEDRLSDEKLAQLAEMRAANENDADDPESGTDQGYTRVEGAEPTPAPAPSPASEKEVKAMKARLDAEDQRHENRIAEIMGQAMEAMAPCPLCRAHGFIPGEIPDDFDPEQREVVMRAMGEGGDATYREHPDLITCETCNGLGHLLTGARNEANYVVSCPECLSKGYINVKEKAAIAQANLDATAPPPAWTPPPTGAPNGVAATDLTIPPTPWLDYTTNPPTWRL